MNKEEPENKQFPIDKKNTYQCELLVNILKNN